MRGAVEPLLPSGLLFKHRSKDSEIEFEQLFLPKQCEEGKKQKGGERGKGRKQNFSLRSLNWLA